MAETRNYFSGLPAVAIAKISEKLAKPDLYSFLEASPNSEQFLVKSSVGFLIQDSLDGQIRSLLLKGIKFIDDPQIPIKTLKDLTSKESSDFKHPLLAKMMILRGTASETNLSRMIQEPTNLQILRINLETLDKISFANHTLNFQYLKELSIFAPNIGYQFVDRDLSNIGFILQNINSILDHANYPQLESLSLDLPFAPNHQRSLMNAIVRILNNHRRTLKKLLINIQGNWEIPGLGFTQNPPDIIGLNLSEFYLRCQNRSPETFVIFHNMLNQLTSLKEIYFDTLDYPPLPIQMITENASTLTSIEMDISLGEIGGFLDCTIFSACIGLKVLTLIANPAVHEKAKADGTEGTPEFLETNFLPPTLVSLRLCHMNIHKTEVDKMAQNLTALKLLELQDIGEDKDLGMTIQALHIFKSETNVGRITVCRGFNRESRKLDNHNGLNWLAERVSTSLVPTSPTLTPTSCISFYIWQGIYKVARGSRDMSLYSEDNLGFKVREYKLQYPYWPFQLDKEDYEKKEDDSDDEDEEGEENEDEENGDENDEGENGGEQENGDEEGDGEGEDDEEGEGEGEDDEDEDDGFYDFDF